MNDGWRAHAARRSCFAHYSQSTTYFEMAEPTPAIASKSRSGENPTQSQNQAHLASQKNPLEPSRPWLIPLRSVFAFDEPVEGRDFTFELGRF